MLIALMGMFSPHKSFSQQANDVKQFYDQKLTANGIVPSNELSSLPYQDKEAVAKFNFDSYRTYDSHAHVLLVNGPKIELESIQERIAKGNIVDSKIVLQKQGSVKSAKAGNVSIPLVNAGVGIRVAKQVGEKF